MAKILAAFLLLLSGLLAYWLVRPGLMIFHWLGIQNPAPVLLPPGFSAFFKNHFADGVWCAAAFLVARWLRERRLPPFYCAFLLALPFLSELAQALHLLPGTFDWVDVLIYALLFLLCFRKEIHPMQPLRLHLIGGLCAAVFLAAVIGSGPKKYTYQTGTFLLPKEKDEVWTKPSLARILQSSKARSIVLRVPSSGKDVTQEQITTNDIIYSTIEKELAKSGFIVRDRGLFSKVLEHGEMDYTKIGALTGTDLILELVRFTNKTYHTTKYRDESGAEAVTPHAMSFTGSVIEFKLVSVAENDMIGSYIFHRVPCGEGCIRRFTPELWNSADVREPVETVVRDFSTRLVAQLEAKQ